jgi:hypothetical protein
MKSSSKFYLAAATTVVFGCLTLSSAHGAGAMNLKTNEAAAATGGKGATTNSASAELAVPLSVFDLSANPTTDPFFPSTGRKPIPDKNTKAAPAVSIRSFQLMAMSGSKGERLAMINHRTLAVGETTEVPPMNGVGGKITIRLMQIKETSVVIRVIQPPQPDLIELSLSKRAQ